EVEMTCWANRRATPAQLQENLAFDAGLRVSIDKHRSWPHSDTVLVTIHAERMTSVRYKGQWDDTTLVAALAECVRASAGQHAARVRYLAVAVKGPQKFARYA